MLLTTAVDVIFDEQWLHEVHGRNLCLSVTREKTAFFENYFSGSVFSFGPDELRVFVKICVHLSKNHQKNRYAHVVCALFVAGRAFDLFNFN